MTEAIDALTKERDQAESERDAARAEECAKTLAECEAIARMTALVALAIADAIAALRKGEAVIPEYAKTSPPVMPEYVQTSPPLGDRPLTERERESTEWLGELGRRMWKPVRP